LLCVIDFNAAGRRRRRKGEVKEFSLRSDST